MASKVQTNRYLSNAKAVSSEIKPFARTTGGFFRKFGNDWATTFAGALAYSLITSLVPIAIALVAIAGFILTHILSNPNGAKEIYSVMNSIPGLSSLKGSLQSSVGVRLSNSAGPLALIAVIVAIFGGSRLFVALEKSMAIIYQVRPRKALQQNIVAILMMVVFTILAPVMIFTSTLPSSLLSIIASNQALRKIPFLATVINNSVTILTASFVGAFIVGFILFITIYMAVPNQRITFANSWPGAVVSAILLEIFVSLFPLYVSHFMQNYIGQVGLVLVLVAFFYYFAIILMLGVEVNAYFFEKVKALPDNLATFISTTSRSYDQDGQNKTLETEASEQENSYSTRDKDRKSTIQEEAQKNQQKKFNRQKREENQQSREAQSTKEVKQRSRNRRKSGERLTTTISVITGSALALFLQIWRQHNNK